MDTNPDSKARMRIRMRRMVYSLFAVYWVLVVACLVFPRMTGQPDEGMSAGTVVTLVFALLLLIALAASFTLAFLTIKHRDLLALADQAMGLIPLAFSLLALVSLWWL